MQQPVGEAGRRLQRVAEGMAEIEQHALAGLALVARDDPGLGAAAHRDGVLARGTAREHVLPVRFQPGEERGVAEQAVFGDLGIAGAEFARRQRIEQRGVGDHQHRLVEGADQVLAMRGIDRGLAADRGIDLRQQRRRHLHVVEPAPHDRCGKAREIADHAAAERNDEIVALDAVPDQLVAERRKMRERFRALARRQHDGGSLVGRLCHCGQSRIEMMLRYVLVADDGEPCTGPQLRDPLAERRELAAADHDVVAARAERDVDDDRIAGADGRGHERLPWIAPECGRAAQARRASTSTISSTILSCGTSRDCTVRSASA